MSALLEKMNSLPKNSSVVLGEDEGIAEVDADEQDKPAKEKVVTDEGVDEPDSKKQKSTPATNDDNSADEDKEPPKTAPKAERDAYKQRKLKAADEEKAREKARADQLEADLKRERDEKEEWKKQAQRNSTQSNPQPATPIEKRDPAADLAKDPVGFLAKGLDEVNNRFKAMEHQQTVQAATGELAELESKYASEKASDYHDVMKHAEDTEVAKMKISNPNLSEASIRSGFKADKVKAAVMFLAQGRDPVEGLYQLARTGYGYRPKENNSETEKSDKEAKAEAEKKRFDAVNKNKSKSATGLSAGGHTGETEVRGPQTTKKRTLRDFSKLTKEQKDADYIAE